MDSIDPDLNLVQRYAVSGDAYAFAELVRRYQDMVYSICLRVLQNRADAEDASQNSFLALAKYARSIRNSVAGWMHRCATSTALQLARERAARQRRESDQRSANTDGGHEQTWQELAPLVDDVLMQLPDQQRQILVEHFLAGKSQRDIASAAGVSEATMSRRIEAALGELRASFSKKRVLASIAVLSMGLASAEAAPPTLSASLAKMGMSGVGSAAAATTAKVGTAAAGLSAKFIAAACACAFLVGATAVVSAPKLIGRKAETGATPGTIVLHYDFEDGVRPATLRDGILVKGPSNGENRWCVAGTRKNKAGAAKCEIVFVAPDMNLVTASHGTRMRFSCWTAAAPLYVWMWNYTRSENVCLVISDLECETWKHIDLPFDRFRSEQDPSRGLSDGDQLGNLAISCGSDRDDALFVDDLTVTDSP